MRKVSVLMATYNGAAHIADQLESIGRQTHRPHELVVSDDGSSDHTLRIVSAFAEKVDFPVRIQVNTERLGYADNFLTATTLCEGDFIAFSDQDDEWHAEKIERCVAALERDDAVLCAHTATLIDGEGRYIGYYDQGIARTEVVPPLRLPPWGIFLGMTQVFRRELLGLIDFARRGMDTHALDSRLAHDRWTYFLAGSLGRIVVLAHPLVAYRQHGKNAYGGLRKSFLTRMRGKLVGSADILSKHEAIARHRAKLMSELADRQAALRDPAEAAADYWQHIAHLYALRTRAYDSPAFSDRIDALRELSRLGAYRGETAAEFGRQVLVKDVVLGLMQVPLAWAMPGRPRSSATASGVKES